MLSRPHGALGHELLGPVQMAEIAETPYIVNWDCDVIIPPAQVYMAVEKLRAGADVVYPYDGRFARMPREPWFKEIERRLDIGIVGATMFENRMEGHMSVGGAVMFNRKSFVDGGMENEKIMPTARKTLSASTASGRLASSSSG